MKSNFAHFTLFPQPISTTKPIWTPSGSPILPVIKLFHLHRTGFGPLRYFEIHPYNLSISVKLCIFQNHSPSLRELGSQTCPLGIGWELFSLRAQIQSSLYIEGQGHTSCPGSRGEWDENSLQSQPRSGTHTHSGDMGLAYTKQQAAGRASCEGHQHSRSKQNLSCHFKVWWDYARK